MSRLQSLEPLIAIAELDFIQNYNKKLMHSTPEAKTDRTPGNRNNTKPKNFTYPNTATTKWLNKY